MARQASEKEHVMSFEEMAESAKSPSLPAEFKFEESPVRVVMKDGEPWFVAKDLCEILDHSNHRMAVSALDDDEKGVSIADTPGGPQETLTVNESGLYSLIFTSRKPEAKRFRKWVTGTVLPEIRKTGSYRGPDGGYSITSVGCSSAPSSTPRSSLSKCSASASISSSR